MEAKTWAIEISERAQHLKMQENTSTHGYSVLTIMYMLIVVVHISMKSWAGHFEVKYRHVTMHCMLFTRLANSHCLQCHEFPWLTVCAFSDSSVQNCFRSHLPCIPGTRICIINAPTEASMFLSLFLDVQRIEYQWLLWVTRILVDSLIVQWIKWSIPMSENGLQDWCFRLIKRMFASTTREHEEEVLKVSWLGLRLSF